MNNARNIQFRLPAPGTPKWKRERAWLLSRGDLSASSRGRTARVNTWLPQRAYDAVRSLASHFKVSMAVFVRAADSDESGHLFRSKADTDSD